MQKQCTMMWCIIQPNYTNKKEVTDKEECKVQDTIC